MKKDNKKCSYLFFLIPGILLCADTVILLAKTSSRTLGIFMPLLLGTPLIIMAVLEYFRPKFLKNTTGKILRILSVCAYSAFTVLFLATTILTFSVGHKDPPDGADVLIVLGCGVRGTRVTLTLSNRLDAAVKYLNRNKETVVIVCGGQGNGEQITEAQAMSEYLIYHGIDAGRILKEDRSASTHENFAYAKAIIDEHFPDNPKICFVTTYFHVYRAGKVAEKHGIFATGFGAPGVWYITFNDYLRECIGITLYTLTGKI